MRLYMEVEAFYQRSDIMNGISTLFSSLNTSSNNISSGINLSEYASIRKGGYYKLLKKYFSENTDNDNKVSSSISTSSLSSSKLTDLKDKTDSVKKSAAELLDKSENSVFSKEKVKAEDGTVSEAYNKDKIYDAVKSFVSDYNSLVESAKDSSVSSISNAVDSMQNITKVNSKMLSSVGITVGPDNKLSVNEDTFKKADMDKVKSMFNTTGAYSYQIARQASMIDTYSSLEAAKANTYMSNGHYSFNYNYGSIFNTTI